MPRNHTAHTDQIGELNRSCFPNVKRGKRWGKSLHAINAVTDQQQQLPGHSAIVTFLGNQIKGCCFFDDPSSRFFENSRLNITWFRCFSLFFSHLLAPLGGPTSTKKKNGRKMPKQGRRHPWCRRRDLTDIASRAAKQKFRRESLDIDLSSLL